MGTTIFVELRFWLLIVLSFGSPILIYTIMIVKRSISRAMVMAFGVALVVISGVDVYLLQSLATLARHTASLIDDGIFTSEISVALYIVPFFFGGIGVNVVSHVVVAHLSAAEKRYRVEHP
ncbi:MAG TPA: hypothetical protein VGN04_07325 [Herbaspirillum sp.]|jgi:hypothetical protein